MIIDVYNHFIPHKLFERLGDLIPGHIALKAFRQLPTLWDIEARLRLLDQFDDVRLPNPSFYIPATDDSNLATETFQHLLCAIAARRDLGVSAVMRQPIGAPHIT